MAAPTQVGAVKNAGVGNQITIATPTGTQAGDVLVAAIFSASSANSPFLTPLAGWTTAFFVQVDSTTQLSVFTRVAGNAEPLRYTWVASTDGGGDTNLVGFMGGYRGCDPTNFLAGFNSTNFAGVATTLNIPVVNLPSAQDVMIVAFAAVRSIPTSFTGGYTTEDGFISAAASGTGLAIALEMSNQGFTGVTSVGPSTATVDVGGPYITCVLALSSSVAGTPTVASYAQQALPARRLPRLRAESGDMPLSVFVDQAVDVLSPAVTQPQAIRARSPLRLPPQQPSAPPLTDAPSIVPPIPGGGGSGAEGLAGQIQRARTARPRTEALSLVLPFTIAESTVGEWHQPAPVLPQKARRARFDATDAPPLQPADGFAAVLAGNEPLRRRQAPRIVPADGLVIAYGFGLAPTVLIYDRFTAANGTNVNGRSPDPTGPAASVVSGTYTVQSNTAQSGTAAVQNETVYDAGNPNVKITAQAFSPNNAVRVGVLARFGASDAASWAVYFDTAAATLIVYENLTTIRASAALTYNANKTWLFTVTTYGATIVGTVTQADNPQNAAQVSYAAMGSNLSNTKVGFTAFGAGGTWDEFRVEAYADPALYAEVPYVPPEQQRLLPQRPRRPAHPGDTPLEADADFAAYRPFLDAQPVQVRPPKRLPPESFSWTGFVITDASRFDWQAEYPGPRRVVPRRLAEPEQPENAQQWSLTPAVLLPALVQDSTQRSRPARGWRVGEPQSQDPPQAGDFFLWGWDVPAPTIRRPQARPGASLGELAFLEVMQVGAVSIIVAGPYVVMAAQLWAPGAEQGDVQEV